ncbi:helix-turn-helix domain-containing protein [Saccharothrix obliqua]|uniref:helix-turn-helix domain-containing protein n=1 Tax=Saccharothrix obliqua TaxID=2861747 RepID=UPI001C5EA25E|nr:helix-turn-helix transcriptional regulator [Saccharothrix obliqua]MBW4718690.1 helix-turn-helix domain-containing protein [Saccharothrix obliqua]
MGRRESLQRQRIKVGLSQERLGEAVGVNARTVRTWESGTSTPMPEQRQPLAHALQVDADQLDRLLAGQPVDDSSGHVEGGPVEQLRMRLDQAFSDTTSAARLEVVEQQVLDHLTAYTRIGPSEALASLIPDLTEVHALAVRRLPLAVHRKLSVVLTMLTLLVADAHMRQGCIPRARRWYRTALLVAHDAEDSLLAALVLAQQTMLAYYYQTPDQAVVLARRARELTAGRVCDAAALAAAAEARALGRLGDARGVHEALTDARRLTDQLDSRTGDDPHAAYRFSHGRLALYTSGALSNLGDVARARAAQDHALTTYAAEPRLVIDPALIQLDRAVLEATTGDPLDGVTLALTTLSELKPDQRTAVVLTRARDVVTEVSPRTYGAMGETVERLRELTAW